MRGARLSRGVVCRGSGGGELALGPAHLSDVLMGGQPTPIRHHAIGNGDEPAVIEFSHLGPFRPAPKRALQIRDVSIGRRTLGVGAARKTMFEEFAKRY